MINTPLIESNSLAGRSESVEGQQLGTKHRRESPDRVQPVSKQIVLVCSSYQRGGCGRVVVGRSLVFVCCPSTRHRFHLSLTACGARSA